MFFPKIKENEVNILAILPTCLSFGVRTETADMISQLAVAAFLLGPTT